jgi:DNA-binding NarL/FixJ family response regulator
LGPVSAIVAGINDAIRNDLIGRTLAAGFRVQSIAPDPQALAHSLVSPGDAWVVTGGTATSAQPFIRVARAAEVPVLAVIPAENRAGLLRVASHRATAVLRSSSGVTAFRAAVVAIKAGLAVWDAEERADSDESGVTASLSPREREVLGRVAAGLTTKVIARQLGLSPNTVKFHLQAVFDKLDVTSRAEAVVAAIRRGELAV